MDESTVLTETKKAHSWWRWSPRSRWAVSAAVVIAVAGAFAAPALIASADDANLPDVTAEELLASVVSATPAPLSGTLVYTARLGLPEIPFAQVGGADPIALLGGSSTLRVWSDGGENSRVALLGSTSEFSVVRNGLEAWTYSSVLDEVVHYTLSDEDAAFLRLLTARQGGGGSPQAAGELPTPQAIAGAALAVADKASVVSVDGQTSVAGRSAYQLVVTPRTGGTLVARIVIAIDAETSMPLRAPIWSTQDDAAPAIEVGFTDIDFTAPDPSVLQFSPPAGATVRDVEVKLPGLDSLAGMAGSGDLSELGNLSDLGGVSDLGGSDAADGAVPEGVTITGTGWETVVEISGVDVPALIAGDPEAIASLPGADRMIGSESGQQLVKEFQESLSSSEDSGFDAAALYDQLTTEVPEGRVISSSLVSILITTDGRVLIGAVPVETLRDMA
jgi:hypothetical protein